MNGRGSQELERDRDAIRPLLSLTDPGDALTAYYALYHSPALTRLYLHRSASGTADGFLATCTTGADLFRPLVVARAPGEDVLRALLEQGLMRGRPYHFSLPLGYAPTVDQVVGVSEVQVGAVLMLDPGAFQPVINVLVTRAEGASGGLRFEIRSQGRVVAAAGTNWRSPHFAEIYVYAEPQGRGRGWGRSVAAACTEALLAQGVRPLYVVAEGDEVSMRLAAGLGYRDTGHREWIAVGALQG